MRRSLKLLALTVIATAGTIVPPASALPPDGVAVHRGSIYTTSGNAATGSSNTQLDRIDLSSKSKVKLAEINDRDVINLAAGFGRIYLTTEVVHQELDSTRTETEVISFNGIGGDRRVETSATLIRTPAGACGTRITEARPVSGSTIKILREEAGTPPRLPDSCASPTKTRAWSIVNVDNKTFPIPFGGIGFEGTAVPITWFASRNVSRFISWERGLFSADEEVRRGDASSGHGSGQSLDRSLSLHAAAISPGGDMALIWQDRTKKHRHRKLVLYPRFGSLRSGRTLSAPTDNPTHVQYCGTKLVEVRGGHRAIVLRAANGKPIRRLWRSPRGGIASRFACDAKSAVFYTWSTVKADGATLRIRNIG